MSVESATYVGDLNSGFPAGGEPIAQGDDHLRLIKTTLLNTFPGLKSSWLVAGDARWASASSVTDLESGKVNKAGDTMTGKLIVPDMEIITGGEGGELRLKETVSSKAATFDMVAASNLARIYHSMSGTLRVWEFHGNGTFVSPGGLTGTGVLLQGGTEQNVTFNAASGYIYGNGSNGGTIGFYKGGSPSFSFAFGSGLLTSGGNIAAYSDIRVKANLEVIPNALEKVGKLNGYTFDRTDINIRQSGLIAQEVQEVLPEVITPANEEGHLAIAYGHLAGLFVEAIKELHAEVISLRAEIAVLKGD